MKLAAILAMVLAALQFAVADDFKTIDGKEYKNVTVSRVEPDGIVLSSKSGISKVYFTELSPEIQKKYGFDPQAAAVYSAEQVATIQQANQQAEELAKQQQMQKAEEQSQERKQRYIQALRSRLATLQKNQREETEWRLNALMAPDGRESCHFPKPDFNQPSHDHLATTEISPKFVFSRLTGAVTSLI